jgi:hypothetical protein
MKFRITLKDPDGVHNSLDEESADSVQSMDLDEEEKEAIKAMRREKMSEFAGKWLEYGEYVTIEFDTEAGTATVVEL